MWGSLATPTSKGQLEVQDAIEENGVCNQKENQETVVPGSPADQVLQEEGNGQWFH